MTSDPHVLLCRCETARVFPREAVVGVATGLRQAGAGVVEVEDLCRLAACRDPLLTELAREERNIRVVACYPRAVTWLFAAAGAPLRLDRTRFFNLRTQAPGEILAGLLQGRGGRGQGSGARGQGEAAGSINHKPSAVNHQPAPPGPSQAWFPVIDFDRCTDCRQCLGFCLFGVYGVDAKRKVAVIHPENCKANCPACSRVCPEAAIMFPKFKSEPINGAEVPSGDLARQAMKADISGLLGGDVYAALRNRNGKSQERFSPDRDPEVAMRERRRILAMLAERGELPPEVLTNLPPIDSLHPS